MTDVSDLEQLRTVMRLLDSAGADYWLAGGWAMDFHLGRITRPHFDIDLVVRHEDKHRLHELLLAQGFTVVDDSDPEAEIDYARGALRLDMGFVRKMGDMFVQPGWEAWPWPESSLGNTPVELEGISARLVGAGTLLDCKRNYEAMVGEPPRTHDLSDIEALRELLGHSD
jgi:hypothetical protein